MKLSIIVLASGNSIRFNGNKLLYEIDNKPMYLHTVDKLIDLKKSNKNVDEIIFVTQYDKIIDNLKDKDIKVVKNNNSEFGISQSIKLGVSNSSNNTYMFIVCDQPYIKKETIDKFINQFIESKKNLGCVSNNNILLNPTIFTSKYKEKLLNLSGDKGGKKIILDNLDDLFTFEILDKKEVIDIDFKYQVEDKKR
ncbi:MAG: nucleotidyltransferase family protein [Intestinibacter bartlettii]|uniref:nucleotidyltransferase family protein n=1 Tax=Intestinibacter bartlettii TaxID=261299 RepID=UPI0026EF58B8|nr:nucleotidyltransferase family protein [Intestinibacter bartlettii]MDO5010438.1 nucleotidyltransferase family protein [Intestinibacter bartlettii]